MNNSVKKIITGISCSAPECYRVLLKESSSTVSVSLGAEVNWNGKWTKIAVLLAPTANAWNRLS